MVILLTVAVRQLEEPATYPEPTGSHTLQRQRPSDSAKSFQVISNYFIQKIRYHNPSRAVFTTVSAGSQDNPVPWYKADILIGVSEHFW